MKEYTTMLCQLFEQWAQEPVQNHILLPQAGSDRRYVRLEGATRKAIGVYNEDAKENAAFIAFTQAFGAKNLNVPALYATNLAEGLYLQEDLGTTALFDLLPAAGKPWPADLVDLYKQTVEALAALQIEGGRDLDYSVCHSRPAFDKPSMLWDLNYFKHYFLKLAKIPFDESALEDDFHALCDFLLEADCSHFLYRDCQSRNIMVTHGKPYFIDYQGGRKGALQYDIASLLYQAKANMPDGLKKSLFEHYTDAVAQYLPIDRAAFERHYQGYVLMRCLQTLGAYGFRGIYERRPHFLSSIPFALAQMREFLDTWPLPIELPTLRASLFALTACPQFKPVDKQTFMNSPLTVRITSFSYKKTSYPADLTGNGGGFVFDCRFIDNPGRYEAYKKLTGRDQPVMDFLRQNSEMQSFLQHVIDIVEKSVENYVSRGFEHLSINFGCTGGQHRSVYSADYVAQHLSAKYGVKIALEHIEQEKKNWIN